MNDLETLVRESLLSQAGEPGARTLRGDTRRQVHRREARFAVGVVGVVAIAVAVAAGLLQILPRGDMRTSIPSDGGFGGNPLEAVPPGWPAVDVGDPQDAFLPPPGGQSDQIIGEVLVLASGAVGGAEFSLLAWTGGGDVANGEFDGPCLGSNGPFTPNVVPPPSPGSDFGGVQAGTCASWIDRPVPTDSDLDLMGQADGTTPALMSNYGFASERVARLEIILADGSTWPVPLLDGPSGWGGVQAFLFFPPRDAEGTLVAYDAAELALARAALCLHGVPSGGCRQPTEQLVAAAPQEEESGAGQNP
jgi:hypothetical protein